MAKDPAPPRWESRDPECVLAVQGLRNPLERRHSIDRMIVQENCSCYGVRLQ